MPRRIDEERFKRYYGIDEELYYAFKVFLATYLDEGELPSKMKWRFSILVEDLVHIDRVRREEVLQTEVVVVLYVLKHAPTEVLELLPLARRATCRLVRRAAAVRVGINLF